MAYLGNTIINGNLKVVNGINVAGTLTQNGTTVSLNGHTHNYAGSASAGGAANSLLNFTSGLNGVAEHNANNVASNGVWYYTSNGPATSLGASTTDGALYSQAHSTSWVGQIAQDYRNGRLFVRGKNNGTWQAWQRIPWYSEVALSGHTHNYAGSSSAGGAATAATKLNSNTELTYGINSLQYFNQNTSTTSGKANANPTSTWYYILRMNHGNNSGYFTDIACSFYDNGRIYRRTMQNGSELGWSRIVTDTSNQHITSGTYGTTGSTTKIKINITAVTTWMLNFCVTLYQGYRATKIMISGYSYGTNHWYSPSAIIISDSGSGTIPVYFGYDDTNKLWVGFDGGSYTGVTVDSAANGYTQISDWYNLFSISNVSSLTTLQTTVNATQGNIRAASITTSNNVIIGGTSGTNYIQLPSGIKLY